MRLPEKKWILVGTIAFAILLFSQCLSSDGHDPRGKAYAGSAACVKCHQRICDSYLHTPHYHAAALAGSGTIAGSFAKDSNTFVVNDTAKVVMEEREGIPYQVLYVDGREKRAERFDIVFGYEKGQTYLYWKNDQIYQLPISWFTGMHRWTSSPGYPPGMPFFDRPVLERCFECHTSFITQTRSQSVNALDRNSMVLNIDCERCHGPAANHVSFHTEFPEEKHGKYIVSYRSLSRSQRIEMCAVCHSGSNNIQLRTIFAFRPGDSLSHFVLPAHAGPDRPDVHGDQVALLTSSKCFKMSNMDCSTCHNTHIDDHGNYARYARLCQKCHTPGSAHFCKLADNKNIFYLEQNCTKCHMPEQASDLIKVKTAETGANTSVYMVNHRIAIYKFSGPNWQTAPSICR
ncbi:MAG TPA: multiheme c-type cytochrome [Puia sp.]|nr:multiheme c-type cytochrome [Puia sp.]